MQDDKRPIFGALTRIAPATNFHNLFLVENCCCGHLLQSR